MLALDGVGQGGGGDNPWSEALVGGHWHHGDTPHGQDNAVVLDRIQQRTCIDRHFR